jgi:hypothetical protein
MKKFLFLLTLTIGMIASVSAQRIAPAITGATLTNADTAYATSAVVGAFYESFAITATVTKSSGTIAGNIVLQGTVDGSTWVSLATADTLADATASYKFSDVPAKYYRYRVRAISTGTSVSVLSSDYYILKGRR